MARDPARDVRPPASLESLETDRSGLDIAEIRRRLDPPAADGWSLLVEKWSRFVWSVAFRLADSGPGREDAAQAIYADVFAELARDDCRRVREFRGDSRFETYLFVMVRHATARRRRTDGVERRRSQPLEALPGGDVRDPSPVTDVAALSGVARERVDQVLDAALARLEPEDRLLLTLRFTEDMTYRRLADILGLRDTNQAAYRLMRALRRFEPLARCADSLHWGDEEIARVRARLASWLRAGADGHDEPGADARSERSDAP